jgi:hypothetical protein
MSERIYHRAHLLADNGDVSPVCADTPKAINMKRATWTTDWEAVTCKKCLAKRAFHEQWKRTSGVSRLGRTPTM